MLTFFGGKGGVGKTTLSNAYALGRSKQERVLVIFLFAALGSIVLRTAKNAQDQFQSLLAATLTVGVVIQAVAQTVQVEAAR